MTSDEIAAIRAAHVAGASGNCAGCNYDLAWPCDAVALGDALAVANARAALWKRAAKAARSDWNDAIGYWHACAEAFGAEKARAEALETSLAATQERERALAEALAFYADRALYDPPSADAGCPAEFDNGETARAALAGTGEDAR